MTAKKAFSLLELSIVIIIVSTITGAVYQGRLLYQKTKLEAARSITSGSPIASVNGLALWLDTTSPDAFTKSYSNDDSIDQWNDTNPQKTSANFAIQTNQSLQPLYVFSGIICLD
jgi:prepilin-type N-terminal cleavage/methylation domain-containing protein